MKLSNLKDEVLGQFIYDKSYLVFDQEPVIFAGHYEHDHRQWVAIMVDLFDASDYGDTDEIVMNYYLAPVNNVMISDLETRNLTLYGLFNNNPLVWITHRYSPSQNKHSTVSRTGCKLSPRYEIAKDSTLCQN